MPKHTSINGLILENWVHNYSTNNIFKDFVATTNLPAAYEELETDRVVRISAKKFPHYFAILSRIREEVRHIYCILIS